MRRPPKCAVQSIAPRSPHRGRPPSPSVLPGRKVAGCRQRVYQAGIGSVTLLSSGPAIVGALDSTGASVIVLPQHQRNLPGGRARLCALLQQMRGSGSTSSSSSTRSAPNSVSRPGRFRAMSPDEGAGRRGKYCIHPWAGCSGNTGAAGAVGRIAARNPHCRHRGGGGRQYARTRMDTGWRGSRVRGTRAPQFGSVARSFCGGSDWLSVYMLKR